MTSIDGQQIVNFYSSFSVTMTFFNKFKLQRKKYTPITEQVIYRLSSYPQPALGEEKLHLFFYGHSYGNHTHECTTEPLNNEVQQPNFVLCLFVPVDFPSELALHLWREKNDHNEPRLRLALSHLLLDFFTLILKFSLMRISCIKLTCMF